MNKHINNSGIIFIFANTFYLEICFSNINIATRAPYVYCSIGISFPMHLYSNFLYFCAYKVSLLDSIKFYFAFYFYLECLLILNIALR